MSTTPDSPELDQILADHLLSGEHAPAKAALLNWALTTALAVKPEKWILKQEDWHKYDTQYQVHDEALDEYEQALRGAFGGDGA